MSEFDKKNSARTKLDLLVCGIQDNAALFNKYSSYFKEEHYAYDNGNWGVDKDRLVPSEIMLPGDIVCKLHIRPDSKYELIEDNGTLLITKNKKEISEFSFIQKPKFWQFETSSGIPMKSLAQMYGKNCLNFNIYSGCEFHSKHLPCHFCSVSSTVKRTNPVKIKKSPSELAEVCQAASKNDTVDYIIVTGGSYLDSDKEFMTHLNVIDAIKSCLPWNGDIKGNISMMPPKDFNLLKCLYDRRVSNPSFNMEVWPQENFDRICPGKSKYVGFSHIIDSLKFLVSLYGSGAVWSNFVAGLTPLECLKDGFLFMAENGIVPGANIYHPEVSSLIENSIKVSHDYVCRLYSFAAELYVKYNYKPYFNESILRNSLANEFYHGLL